MFNALMIQLCFDFTSGPKIDLHSIISNRGVMTEAKARRGRGRPSNPDRRSLVQACKYKHGCGKAPAKGQVYCSREHSPFGMYAMDSTGWKTNEVIDDECET